MPPPGSDAGLSVDDVYEYLGKSPRYIALSPEGGIVDDVPEPGPEAAVDPERDPEPEWEAPPDAGNLLSVGAAAGGAQVLANTPVPHFQGPQVHAMTGDLEGQQELPWGRRPQGLAGVQGARDVLGGAVPWTPNPENVVRPHVGGEPPPLPPPVSPMISQMAGPMD